MSDDPKPVKSCGTCAHSYHNESAVMCRLGCWERHKASGWKGYMFNLPHEGADCDTYEPHPEGLQR